jgi:outer membrane protein
MVMAESGPPVTMVEAYESTMARNFGLRSQESVYQAEQAATREAFAAVLPQIEGSASYGTSWFTRDFGPGQRLSDRDESTRYDVSLSQVLYSKRTFENISRARAGEARAELELEGREEEIGFAAVEAYLVVLRLSREVKVIENEQASHQRRLDQLQSKLERGLATRADTLEAQARIDEVGATLAGLRYEFSAARQNLSAITGLDLARRSLAFVQESLWENTPLLLDKPWFEIASEQSSELEVARAEVKVAEAARSAERAGHLPELTFRARHTNNDTFATNLREETRVEIQLSVPIYKGGATTARSRQAAHRLEATELDLRDRGENVAVQIARITTGLEGSYAKIVALEAAQSSGAASLEAAERGFERGVRSLNDVLDARNRASRIQRDLVREIYSNLTLQFELKQVAGVLSKSDVFSATL